MVTDSPLLVLLPVIVGAIIGIVPSLLLERLREKSALRTRWDKALYRSSVALVASARHVRHLSERLEDGRTAELEHNLDRSHARLRTAAEEVRILGNQEVQKAVWALVRQAYAVRTQAEQGVDRHADENPILPPQERFRESLREFYVAIRAQLKVPSAQITLSADDFAGTETAVSRSVQQARRRL